MDDPGYAEKMYPSNLTLADVVRVYQGMSGFKPQESTWMFVAFFAVLLAFWVIWWLQWAFAGTHLGKSREKTWLTIITLLYDILFHWDLCRFLWIHMDSYGFNLRVGLIGGPPPPPRIIGTIPAIRFSRFKRVSNGTTPAIRVSRFKRVSNR